MRISSIMLITATIWILAAIFGTDKTKDTEAVRVYIGMMVVAGIWRIAENGEKSK